MARYDFCPHCGTVNNGGDFCANCGAPLTAPDAGSPQDMQTVPIPVLTTPQGYLDQDAGRSICRKWLRIFRRMSLIDVGFEENDHGDRGIGCGFDCGFGGVWMDDMEQPSAR